MNQILDSLTYDPERGTLALQSLRYVLLSPNVLADIQKSVEESLGHETRTIFAQAAAAEGTILASRFRDVFGYPPEQVLSAIAFLLSESGFGLVVPEMTNLEARELVFKIVDSPLADAYGPSTQSVCHTTLGILQGVAAAIFDAETTGMEVQCTAKGDTCCRFVVTVR
jgi:predicted hydrocarbon binding protein